MARFTNTGIICAAIHSTVKVSTLRAIFSISEFQGLKSNDDGLKENPCYPKELIDDPGWALLTDDEWYKDHPASAKNVDSYRKAPSKAMVDAAKAKVDAASKNGEKLDSIGAVDLKEMMKRFKVKTENDMWNKWVGTGDGQIPEELWGILPTIPKFPKPKKRSLVDAVAANDTLSLEDRDAEDLDWDGHEDDLENMGDEECASRGRGGTHYGSPGRERPCRSTNSGYGRIERFGWDALSNQDVSLSVKLGFRWEWRYSEENIMDD